MGLSALRALSPKRINGNKKFRERGFPQPPEAYLMTGFNIIINGLEVRAEAGETILDAARRAEVYIPTLCHHPDLVPGGKAEPVAAVYQGSVQYEHSDDDEGRGCGLCVVEVEGEGELKPACATEAAPGLVVTTESDRITAVRREKLAEVLADHPHACLTCAQNEGCTRTQCSSNVAENERCCPQLGHCELQAVAQYVGIAPNTPPLAPHGPARGRRAAVQTRLQPVHRLHQVR